MNNIDRDYFEQYAGSGKSYDEAFLEHSGAEECFDLFAQHNLKFPKSVCVLGAATGKILAYIYDRTGLLSYGCELNRWAHAQIPTKFQRRVERQDMRSYIQKCRNFDLIFSNSLMYLKESEIRVFLKHAQAKCHYFHYEGSYWGASCPDPYRKTLKTLNWWRAQFAMAGFKEIKLDGVEFSFLWQSV